MAKTIGIHIVTTLIFLLAQRTNSISTEKKKTKQLIAFYKAKALICFVAVVTSFLVVVMHRDTVSIAHTCESDHLLHYTSAET